MGAVMTTNLLGLEEAQMALNWLVVSHSFAALSGAEVLILGMSGHQGVALKIFLYSGLLALLETVFGCHVGDCS